MTPDDAARLLNVGERDDIPPTDPRVRHLAALSAEMGAVPPDKDAPVREVVARLGDNWSALILKVLAGGEFRHATLKRVMSELASEGAISQRMLTLRLRALERDGVVARREEDSVQPRVYYRLTPMGQDLNALHSRVLDWIMDHDAAIHAARAGFSATER